MFIRLLSATLVFLIADWGIVSAAESPNGATRPDQEVVVTPSGEKGLRGLRGAPDIPVDSIILRRAFPDHPVPGARRFPEPPTVDRPGDPEPAAIPGTCDTVDPGVDSSGILSVSVQDNGICTNADIDTYVSADGTTYVVQAGGQNAAWTLTDVSDPADPFKFTTICWSVDGVSCDPYTYTPDVKAFNQGGND